MIPKIIHYCWFSGDKKPESIQHCIDSWKRVMPDYEIRCWGPDSFDFDSIPFVKEAFEARKWAFVADYIRQYAIYTYGGIYLDSDVEVYKTFDEFLDEKCFIGTEVTYVKEKIVEISPEIAIFGAEPGMEWQKELLEYYKNRHFLRKTFLDTWYDLTPAPRIVFHVLEKRGYVRKDEDQLLDDGSKVFSSAIFTNITYPQNSPYAIHKFASSWRKEGGNVYALMKFLKIRKLYPWYVALRKKMFRSDKQNP